MNYVRAAVDKITDEMIKADITPCVNVYWDDSCKDNCIICFMEEDGTTLIHDLMHELYSRLSNALGYPVCISHNHPTDGSILILGNKIDSRLYDPKECCRKDLVDYYNNWVTAGRPNNRYQDHYRAIFTAVEQIAKGMEETTEETFARIPTDQDPLVFLLNFTSEVFA